MKPIVNIDESGLVHDIAPKGQSCDGKHDWPARGRTTVSLNRFNIACMFQCNIDSAQA